MRLWGGKLTWPHERLCLWGFRTGPTLMSSSCRPLSFLLSPSFPAAQWLGFLQLRDYKSPPSRCGNVPGPYQRRAVRGAPYISGFTRCFPPCPPNLPPAQAGEAPRVQTALSTDGPHFLPLSAAPKHSRHPELLSCHLQQVKE